MKLIQCEDCGKRYDYDRDEFCPRCGAFNQPVKTWTTDSQGNVRRVDGINEANHAGSFVHSEVHREKRVRQAKGMDWTEKKKPVNRPMQSAQRPAAQQKRNTSSQNLAKIIFWIVATIIFVNFIIPFLFRLFG